MSQGKQIKKCRQNFNVYIPPPARKAENLSKEVIKKEESKNQNVKVRSSEKVIVNNKTVSSKTEISGSHSCNSSPTKEGVKQTEVDYVKSDCPCELSVTLKFSKLVCGDGQKFKEKHCPKNQSGNSVLSRVEGPKDSGCKCAFSDKSNTSEKPEDTFVKQSTVKVDLNKITCNTPQEPYKKSPNEQSNDTFHPDEENRIFKNLWVKLCEHENLESKTTKTHSNKGNDVYGEINENCILEIYDFPAEFKTSDLRDIFSSYMTRGMKIRWVDDTHALGIYPSEIFAYEVLNTDLPNLKTRILNEGIPESRDKAKLLLPPPPPPRPKTCSASARRMVSGALGIKAVFTQAEIEEEKQLLQVAREQRLLAKQRGLKGS
ncbi:R3H and coiled-coil domain-containing protein 1 [Halyomorpha halys]|uniref:R3H and coiled-coil domain-containing protein 1 n=1 Tax=Halyomorpha halys TaxID=286706 RepID=UPI0006D4FD7C|nr:R3H and coiled-coil domain-containing protein 1 [Halyomorpha halys]